MMVVHEDSETPVEVAIIRKPLLEQKSYVIVKNHVRELLKTNETTSPATTSKEISTQPLERDQKKKLKSDRKLKKTEQIPVSSMECVEETNNTTEIDKNDLEELRTVYNKCKEVMSNIESKYGHLLEIDSAAGPKKRKFNTDEYTDECNCKLNTKIVFDDEGKQSTVETVPEKHICVKKANKSHTEMQTRSRTIAIEYTENEIALSDNLQDLARLLQNPDLDQSVRNRIVEKMKIIKQENANLIKFDKDAIISKLKANPDEILAFKGTNLSTIPGYH